MKKRRNFSILLIIVFILFYFYNRASSQSKEFYIFDGLMVKDKPDLTKYNLSKIYVIYEDSLLDRKKNKPSKLNLTKLNREISKIKDNSPVCVDIESWLLNKNNLFSSIIKYNNVINNMKSRISNPIGYYGILPHGDIKLYQIHTNYFKSDTTLKRAESNEWNYINGNLAPIAEVSNLAFPSCYTRFNDTITWKLITYMQIENVKGHYPNLKIYAFIWPQYYAPGFGYNNKFLSYQVWMCQLQYLYNIVDGIVIWHPPFNLKTRELYKWDENVAWFQATKDFINMKNIKTYDRN